MAVRIFLGVTHWPWFDFLAARSPDEVNFWQPSGTGMFRILRPCDGERAGVIEYLGREGVKHGEVGDWPAWHVWPYVAVWAIESAGSPGRVGWWAVSGDLPTDYTGCGPQRHPREGLRDIATHWKAAARMWSESKSVEGWSVGAPEDRPALAPLLAARAELLSSYAADDDLWSEG